MLPNLPEAFISRIKDQLRDEWDDFLESLEKTAKVSFRINPKKVKNMLSLECIPWSEHGYFIDKRPYFALDPLFHGGCYYIQEASSMLLEEVIKQLKLDQQDIKILDLCGAPGGKATNILAAITDGSLLITNETIRSRADVLKENIYKWGYHNVVVTNNDPSAYSSLTGFFDAIVVDAPCSGEGLFRKDPGAVNEWSEANLRHCSVRQQRILHDVWPSLKENGYLIYSTCTYNPEENEKNLSRFIKEKQAISIPVNLDQFSALTKINYEGIEGFYSYPHKSPGEGFFISVLQKTGEEKEINFKKNKEKRKASAVPKDLGLWVKDANDLYNSGNAVIIFPQRYHDLQDTILLQLNCVSIGLPAATIKHQNIIPEPALALCTSLNSENLPIVELNLIDALKFLKKENTDVPLIEKGFNLMAYKTCPLGWIKVIDQYRSNNYWPKEWRLRMDIPEDWREIEHSVLDRF